MDNYTYVQHLFQIAEKAASLGDWEHLYLARAELNRVDPSAVNSLWQADAARMLGLLPVSDSFEAEEISMLQGEGHLLFPNLLAAAIEIGGVNTTELAKFDISLFSGNDRLVRAVAYAILQYGFETSDLDRLSVSEHPAVQIREFQNKSMQLISEEYVVDVSKFLKKLPSESQNSQKKIAVESAQIIRLTNATTWIESDAILVDGQFVIDQAGRLGGRGVNFNSDVRIKSANDEKVIVTASRSADQINVKRGLFLAYPMTQAWGHFYRSVLGRLAFALEIYPEGDLDLILSSRVTQAGRDAIQMLHPKLRLHFFDPNTEIMVEELLIVPSRGFIPEEIMPGSEFDRIRLTTDIEAMRIIRARFQESFKTETSSGNCLYWSRGTANYRKGNSDQILEQRALALGLDVADLGSLSFSDQREIVAHTQSTFGFYGSHLNNVATMAPIGSSHLIVTNDRPYEWQTLYLTMSELLETEPVIVQGHSRLPLPYYAPENYHSSTELNLNQIDQVTEQMSRGLLKASEQVVS